MDPNLKKRSTGKGVKSVPSYNNTDDYDNQFPKEENLTPEQTLQIRGLTDM